MVVNGLLVWRWRGPGQGSLRFCHTITPSSYLTVHQEGFPGVTSDEAAVTAGQQGPPGSPGDGLQVSEREASSPAVE